MLYLSFRPDLGEVTRLSGDNVAEMFMRRTFELYEISPYHKTWVNEFPSYDADNDKSTTGREYVTVIDLKVSPNEEVEYDPNSKIASIGAYSLSMHNLK